MIQADSLPLCEMLDSSVIAEAFEEDNVVFSIADEDVFTPAITLWAIVSQFLFKDTGRSCKAAAGRVVSLWAQIAGRTEKGVRSRIGSLGKPSPCLNLQIAS